jgi:hypothetical protein
MNPHYEIVSQRANFICEYCCAPESAFNFPFEVDHFTPLSRGGTKELDNLVLACRACNAFKAFHQIGLHENTEDVPLFNPRQHNWDEHFRVNLETFEIEGLTEIGVGTINRLKMNDIRQVRARNLWNQFEIFP